MKVLEKGKKVHKKWSKELRCSGLGTGGGGCDALLLVEKEDVYKTRLDASDSTYRNTFRCPECGIETCFSCLLPFKPPIKAVWLFEKESLNSRRLEG